MVFEISLMILEISLMVLEISLLILEIRSRVFRKLFYVSMILAVNAPAQSIILATLQSVLVTLSLPFKACY